MLPRGAPPSPVRRCSERPSWHASGCLGRHDENTVVGSRWSSRRGSAPCARPGPAAGSAGGGRIGPARVRGPRARRLVGGNRDQRDARQPDGRRAPRRSALRVREMFLWRNERRPGEDDFSRAEEFVVHGPIPPRGALASPRPGARSPRGRRRVPHQRRRDCANPPARDRAGAGDASPVGAHAATRGGHVLGAPRHRGVVVVPYRGRRARRARRPARPASPQY